jgi:peptidoglycan/LPS O-acetylase OafA/YrhL
MERVDIEKRWELGHRPALDGLRGLAILLVLVAHFGAPAKVCPGCSGNAGVTVFFTLSGFLITALLLEELAGTGAVSLRRFYVRRARRLGPALIACLLLALVLELTTMGRVSDGDLFVGALTYTSNLLMIDGHWGHPAFIGQMWSLAVEEQFYLVWPVIFLGLSRLPRRTAMILLGYAAMAGVVLRHFLYWHAASGMDRNWFGPDARSDALLIGCLLAFYLHGRPTRTVGRVWVAAGALLVASLLPWSINFDPERNSVLAPLLAALAGAMLVYGAVNRPTGKVLGAPVLRYVGARSYGLYLYHYPILAALHQIGRTPTPVTWLVAGSASFAVAELSWRYVESPFLSARRVVRGNAGGGEGGAVVGDLVKAPIEQEADRKRRTSSDTADSQPVARVEHGRDTAGVLDPL